MLCVPVPITLGVYVDVHVAGLLAVNVHAVNVPVPLLASAIVPPGALCGPMSVSVTVTVQVLASFTGIEPGAQLTTVVVVRGLTVCVKPAEVLPTKSSSPLSIAVMVCPPTVSEEIASLVAM